MKWTAVGAKVSAIVLLLGAAVCLVLAFATPFVSNDFDVKLTKADYAALLHRVVDARTSFRGRLSAWAIDTATSSVIDRLDDQAVNRLNQHLKEYALDRGGIKVGDYYLWGTIRALWQADELLVASAVFLFSVLFPGAKILLLGLGLALRNAPLATRQRVVALVRAVSRWSMGDVFVVALMIVMFKATSFHYQFKTEAGVFCYAGSFLCAALAAALLGRTLGQSPAHPDQ